MKTHIKTMALAISTLVLSNASMAQTPWSGTALTGDSYRTGNVGIGTSSPSEKLDVNGNIVIPFGNFFGTSGTTYKKLLQTGWDATNLDYLSFYTAGANAADQNEKMRITMNGNVGIGINNPKARLHIYESTALTSGSGQFMPLTSVSGNTGSNAFHHNTWLQRNSSGLGSWSDVVLVDGVSIDGSFANLNSTTGDNAKTWWKRHAYSNTQTWGDGSNTYMALEQGKLCIGAKRSSAHSNALLSVDGKIVCKDLYVTASSDWPDFVFEKNYKLASLSDVRAYYEKNNHLPNVPTACEIEEKGINMSEMSAIQMQKIEELTMYIVQLKDELDELKKQISVKENKHD